MSPDKSLSKRAGKTCIAPVAVNVALVPGGSTMNRMRPCDAVRRSVGPQTGGFSRSRLAAGFDPGGFPRSIDQLFVRSRSDSTLGGELPTARCGPRITFVSSMWTTRQVDQVPNTEAFANLPQVCSGGHKETAQQSIPAEALHPLLLPALGVAILAAQDERTRKAYAACVGAELCRG